MGDIEISSENVAQLMEMGFSNEAAAHALRSSENDIEKAIGILFQDPTPSNDPPPPPTRSAENQLVKLDSHNRSVENIERPTVHHSERPHQEVIELDSDDQSFDRNSAMQEEPRFSQQPPFYRPSLAHLTTDAKDSSVSNDSSTYSLNEYGSNTYLADSSRNEKSIYQAIEKYNRDNQAPPVLLPTTAGFLESYFAPLLMILHEIYPFRNAFFEIEGFPTYGFHPRWFSGDLINLPNTPEQRYILEIQRHLAFLDGDSYRFFASIKNLTSSFPNDFKREFENVESVEEFIPIIYKSFEDYLGLAAKVESSKISNLMNTKVISLDSPDQVQKFSHLNVEPESIRNTLFETLVNLIWGPEFDSIDKVHLTEISDIVTIVLESNIQALNHNELIIQEVFYPHLFSDKHVGHIKNMLSTRDSLRDKRHELNREKVQLSTHKGKSIPPLVSSAIGYLQSQVANIGDDSAELQAALEDLTSLREAMLNKREDLTIASDTMAREEDNIDLFNMEGIISSISEDERPEPYILTGVVIDDHNFFYLMKSRDGLDDTPVWVCCQYSGEIINDFHIRVVSFEYVESIVEQITGSAFENSIILVYTRITVWDDGEMTPIPEGLRVFLEKDLEERKKTEQLLEESSDEDADENMDVISDEEEDEFDDESVHEVIEVKSDSESASKVSLDEKVSKVEDANLVDL